MIVFQLLSLTAVVSAAIFDRLIRSSPSWSPVRKVCLRFFAPRYG